MVEMKDNILVSFAEVEALGSFDKLEEPSEFIYFLMITGCIPF